MTPKRMRAALKTGGTLLGTLITSPSPYWPKVIGGCGLDFVFIDTEHIALDRERLSWMCRTYAALGLPPLVRIPDRNPDRATKALDDGAAGVVVPYTETPETAAAMLGATKRRPLKGGRLRDHLQGAPLESPLETYLRPQSENTLLVLNIESAPAIANLPAILDNGEIDAVLIGPHDLTASLGIPENYRHPKFLAAAESIFTQARDRGVGAGIHAWFSIEEHAKFVALGANLLIHKADVIFFQEGLKSELSALRHRLGIGDDRPAKAADIGI